MRGDENGLKEGQRIVRQDDSKNPLNWARITTYYTGNYKHRPSPPRLHILEVRTYKCAFGDLWAVIEGRVYGKI